MVLNPRIEIGEGRLPGQRLYAGLIGAALVVELIITFAAARYAPAGTEFTPEKIIRIGHPEAIAGLLFTEFLLPFEITSLLLLVAIVGVIVLAKRRKSD
jgi:NADH-quinone oxidoreductase subunit J